MTEQEQINIFRKDFESIHGSHARCVLTGNYVDIQDEKSWQGFLMAKRSQPIVVLPKPDTFEISFNYGDFVTSRNVYDSDEVHASLTAAGIKYTIGE